ncbi:MAG: HD domain-containing protein [Betaproteobacteria bacterium]
MSNLARAIAIAAQAHEHQLDKAGAPYVLRPIRMLLKMDSEPEKIAAVLHDVVEDTGWTSEKLAAEGFSEEVLSAVRHLTKMPGEQYGDFIRRAAENPIARKVKLADLEDNIDVRRLGELAPKDIERIEKYHRHWLALKAL